MVNNNLKEVCILENVQFLLHENINSELYLFPDRLHPNKRGQGVLKQVSSTNLIFDSFLKRKISLLKAKRIITFC